ncbi:MAG: sugar phosphate isomerase/epimerase [Clostridia bacterium]|nr:sugar phosphate isomerase/epimerase [Clostridia bacterium]
MVVGAQLYTVTKSCQTLEDLSETLKRVADIGYTTVQLSGVCEYEPEWMKEELKKNGLSCALTHISLDSMKADPVKVCRDHDILGCKYIGLGMMPNARELNDELYDSFVKDIRPIVQTFAKEGHKFFYHNHHYEFMKSPNGKLYIERLAEDFSPEEFGVTLDTYWVQFGGANPLEWIDRLKGRIECVHLKDMKIVGKEQWMAPVGAGNMNFERIVDAAGKAGAEYLLVEQDKCYDEDPFECLKQSRQFLASLGL